MILDSSALIAVLWNEPEGAGFIRAIQDAAIVRMSAVNYLEAAIVADALRDPIASREFDRTLRTAGVRIEPVTEEQAHIARFAYRDFGKGSGHPAHLNFGDCFCYALAKVTGEPLLYKGRDFSCTDVAAAVPPL